MQQSQLLKLDLFRNIVKYLSVKDLLVLQQICSQLKENVQTVLKTILADIGFQNLHTTTPQNIIFKTIYGRESYFWAFDESVKPFKRKHILGMPVKQFQVGLTFTGILTHQNMLYTCASQEYTDLINQKPNFSIKRNVKQFSTSGKGRIIYLTEEGNLYIKFEHDEEFLISKDVEYFDSSYYILVAITKLQETKAIFYQLQDVTVDNCNQPQRYKRILIPENEIITQVACGSNSFYLLTKSQRIFTPDTQQKQENIVIDQIIKTIPIPYFDNKFIIQIYSGLSYFLALGREEIKSIKDWNNEKILQWLEVIGFSDYVNIVKYSEFTGKEFAENAVKQDFQINTLGLTNVELQIKLSTEITRALEPQQKDYQLFGWGKNDYGQLALPISNNVQYTKLQLPPLEEEDDIVQIECGWKNVAILTHSGKLYLTENLQKIQKKEKEVQVDDQGKKRKKSRQEPVHKEYKEQKEVKEPDQPYKNWSNISKIFIKPNDKREYRHFYVNLSKEYLVTICSIYDKKLMMNYFPDMLEQKQENKKFKPTLQVIDRILWDLKFNKDDFVVGYEDRFLGIMEVTFNDFLISQVKSHRVQYFKQLGKIVWDRNRRLDLL